ncbi:hypothetical protein [Pseudoduganella violaceinigra]|uniref:hypothetical protein n=1 Tax=Pseudoduganella violaceinigra TaxID=246602 RepID=UPI0004207119|nr:hypothetical protein [Pseudoduganella violaceinigra]
MNVNSINSSSFASQVASGGGADKTRQAPPPPPPGPPPGEGGFVSAIGAALESLGVSEVAASDKDNAASAIGSFLQELMASLHKQGEAKGAQPGDGFGRGGPGRLADDLTSLVSSLQSDSPESAEASSLETSFSSLLESLGADSSDSQSKLAGFLQTLADKLPQSGSRGNLVNTTA